MAVWRHDTPLAAPHGRRRAGLGRGPHPGGARRGAGDRRRGCAPRRRPTRSTLLRQWDEVSRHLSNVAAVASLLANVHPLEAVRTALRAGRGRGRPARHRAAPGPGAVRRVRRRRPGRARPGRGPAARPRPSTTSAAPASTSTTTTRARLAEINERLTEVDQEFGRTIRDDVRTVRVTADRLAGLPQDWLDAHPAGDDGLVTVTTDYPDAVPVRMFAHDAGVRRRGDGRLPRARLARERVAAAGAVRAAPRAGDAGRLRRLGVVRRRREDDREGPGDPRVHRPDRGRRGGADAARPRAAARALPPRRPRRRPRSRPPTPSTTRSWSARSSTTSTPSRCAPTSTSPGPPGAARRDRPAVRAAVRRGAGRAGLARGRDGVRRASATARGSAGSTSTCTRARASTSTPRSSRSPTGSPAGSSPRACWSATSPAG